MRIVTCIAAAALTLSASAAGAGPSELVVPLTDGSIAFVSPAGNVVGTLVGTRLSGFGAGAPSWSPDGTRIAFAQGGIFVAGLDGTLRRLTVAPQSGFDTEPTWSPDGKEIAFRRSRDGGGQDIYAVDADTGSLRRLTMDSGYKQRPLWQPYGRLVLFQGEGPEGAVLFTVDATTGTVERVAAGFSPGWSPDGAAIAFASTSGLEVMAADGDARRVVVPKRSVSEPAWSPDGRRIAFRVLVPFAQYCCKFGIPTQSDVYVVDADGSDLARLTGFEGDSPLIRPQVLAPRWWPGGSRLFFLHGANRSASDTLVWTVNADGTCEDQFAASARLWDAPQWSPTAAGAPAVECSSAQIRLSSSVGEVGLHDAVPLAVVVRNDGTRSLERARITLTASRGRFEEAGADCTAGQTMVCRLGALAPGAEVSFSVTARVGGAGLARYTATVAWDGEPDIRPEADVAAVAVSVPLCDIVGTWGSDHLIGTPKRDRICARPGADRIDGRAGNDDIDAGSGADTVIGGPGRDTIRAGGGGDIVYVRDGERDVVDCGTEQDIVVADRRDRVSHCEKVLRR